MIEDIHMGVWWHKKCIQIVKILKCPYGFSLFSTLRESSVNRNLHALTLVGPTGDNPVTDPLAVLHLDSYFLRMGK